MKQIALMKVLILVALQVSCYYRTMFHCWHLYGIEAFDILNKVYWFKHILFMTEHDKGLGRAKKLCLALSKSSTNY